MWFDGGVVYFATTQDDRVYAYHCASRELEVLYDGVALGARAPLNDSDNVTVSPVSGDLYVCEDAGDHRMCIISTEGEAAVFVQLPGEEHANSELTGPVFDPTGSRLYFASQRAVPAGVIFEISGPFRKTRKAGAGGSNLSIRTLGRPTLRRLLRTGQPFRLDFGGQSRPVEIEARLVTRLRRAAGKGSRQVTIGRLSARSNRPGSRRIRMRVDRRLPPPAAPAGRGPGETDRDHYRRRRPAEAPDETGSLRVTACAARRVLRSGPALLLLAGTVTLGACSTESPDPAERAPKADSSGKPKPGKPNAGRSKPGKPNAGRPSTRPPGRDRDCASFRNQAAAQRALAGGDPHGLDGDGDGVACSSLPCPCSKVAPGGGPGSPADRAGPDASGSFRSFRARVVSVTDGDTIEVAAAGIPDETIRLIGIDTPEVYGGVECGGREASAEMKRLATGMVTVRTDPTQDRRDRYGRLLAYINKAGRDLGRAMVARGLAPAYVYDNEFSRYPAYRKAESKARAARRGSWKHCDMGN